MIPLLYILALMPGPAEGRAAQATVTPAQGVSCLQAGSAPEQHVGKTVSWLVRIRDVEGEGTTQRTLFDCRDASGSWGGLVIGPALSGFSPPVPLGDQRDPAFRARARILTGRIVAVEQRKLPDGTVANVPVVGQATLVTAAESDAVAPGATNRVSWPSVLREEKPQYTEDAMRAKIEGSVELEIVVRDDGTVGSVRVVKSLDAVHGLDQAAMTAAGKWLFKPGIKDGVPVATRVGLVLEFKLKR